MRLLFLEMVRLILIIAGFLLAIAASGLPIDRITIVLGALGVDHHAQRRPAIEDALANHADQLQTIKSEVLDLLYQRFREKGIKPV